MLKEQIEKDSSYLAFLDCVNTVGLPHVYWEIVPSGRCSNGKGLQAEFCSAIMSNGLQRSIGPGQ
jgi:hypothetical protein